MTFLQKFLGKNYKWFYVFRYEWAKTGASNFADFISQFQIFTFNLLWVYTWSLNSSSNVVYLLVGRIFAYMVNNFWYNKVANSIITGALTNVLILPNSTFKIYFFQSLGARLYRNILSTFTISLVAAIFNFWVVKIPFSWNILTLIPLIPLIFLINFLTGMIISSIAFFIKDKRDFGSLAESIQQILNILTGFLIPLNQIPLLGQFLVWLPFSINFYHPTQIYLGKYNFEQTAWVFVGGIAWCCLLYFLAKKFFQMGLKKNESVGL